MDRINECSRFKLDEVRMVIKSVLKGLQKLHQHGYMHRDIKPDNILLRDYGSYDCAIGDFGLVENIQQKDWLHKRCGTPGYLAPEIANMKNEDDRYDAGCDVFSLGIVFHYMLLGNTPFIGRTKKQVLKMNR